METNRISSRKVLVVCSVMLTLLSFAAYLTLNIKVRCILSQFSLVEQLMGFNRQIQSPDETQLFSMYGHCVLLLFGDLFCFTSKSFGLLFPQKDFNFQYEAFIIHKLS